MDTTLISDEAADRGQLGPVAVAMMVRVFAEELGRFPGLGSAETPEDFAYEFFADRGTTYVDAVLATPDDDAAARLTRSWARHWLIDLVRKLPYGALRARIEKRLLRSSLFCPSAVAHHWCLVDGVDEDRNVSDHALLAATATVQVDVLVQANGRVVLGRDGQFEALLREMLATAGRLHIADITHLCARRFPSTLETGDSMIHRDLGVEMDEAEATEEADDWIFATAVQKIEAHQAQEIFDQLSETERLALRHADDANQLAGHLGVGRSSAYSHIRRAKTRLIELAGSGPRAKVVLTDVLALILDIDRAVPSVEVGGA